MRTLLITLGGGAYPYADVLRHDAFARSSRAIVDSLTGGNAPTVDGDDHLDLFDDNRAWPEQLMAIRGWLRAKLSSTPAADGGPEIENVVVHYVGHGIFKANSEEHYLTINGTDADDRTVTSASLGALNGILFKEARRQRRYYIIDACFAAASLQDLMGPVENILEVRVGGLIAPWPESGQGSRGVAALCSADKRASASAAGQRQLTQFTDGLLSVLEAGDGALNAKLSLRRAYELLRGVLHQRYGEDAVKPVLVAPEDQDGGIAAVPVFPNAAMFVGPARAGPNLEEDGAPVKLQGSAVALGTGVQSSVAKAPVAEWSVPAIDGSMPSIAGGLSPEQHFRQLAYRFFRLMHSDKEAIVRTLPGLGAIDASLPDLERYKSVLAKVQNAGGLDQLEAFIRKAEGE